ncbi:MAG: hypothetical protein ACM3ZB_07285 [bacterium]|jgi:hypothetical protein
MRLVCLLLAAAPLLGQIEPARIGCYIDSRRALRAIYGTAGNFVVSEPLRLGVLAAACTDTLTIVKTEAEIEVNGTVYAAPAGPARVDPDGLVCYEAGGCERFGPPQASAPDPESYRVEGAFLIVTTHRAAAGAGRAVPGNARMGRAPQRTTDVERRIELPEPAEGIEYLGPGWLRIRLSGGGHMAFSRERGKLYRLPDAPEGEVVQ